MRTAVLPIALLAMATATACSSFSPRGPFETPGDGPFPGPRTEGFPDNRSMDSPMLDQRQACRTGAIPRGWIAIRYLQLPRDCPETRDEGDYNGVLLQYHADRAPGTVLEVCADQAIPSGWVRDSETPRGVCEGARVKAGEPTMRVIRRVR